MVVEDDLDRGVGRIGAIQPLEKADELTGAMAVFATRINLSRHEIDTGEKAQGAVTNVFVIAHQAGMRTEDARGALPR